MRWLTLTILKETWPRPAGRSGTNTSTGSTPPRMQWKSTLKEVTPPASTVPPMAALPDTLGCRTGAPFCPLRRAWTETGPNCCVEASTEMKYSVEAVLRSMVEKDPPA